MAPHNIAQNTAERYQLLRGIISVLTPEWQVAIYDFKHAPEHQRIFCDRIGREKSMTLSLVMFGASIVWLNKAGAVSSPALVFVFTLFYGKGQRLAAPALLRLDQYRER